MVVDGDVLSNVVCLVTPEGLLAKNGKLGDDTQDL